MPESDFINTGQDSGIENFVKKLNQILVKKRGKGAKFWQKTRLIFWYEKNQIMQTVQDFVIKSQMDFRTKNNPDSDTKKNQILV